MWFASAYYVFRTGRAKAFPKGLKMKASNMEKVARVRAECAGRSACERWDARGCRAYKPSNQAGHGFLPTSACHGSLT